MKQFLIQILVLNYHLHRLWLKIISVLLKILELKLCSMNILPMKARFDCFDWRQHDPNLFSCLSSFFLCFLQVFYISNFFEIDLFYLLLRIQIVLEMYSGIFFKTNMLINEQDYLRLK